MRRGVVWLAGLVASVAFVFVLSGCGGTNTEGQTLEAAQATLAEAGVAEQDITVTGPEADEDPATLSVCEQTPSGAEEGDAVTLEVATACPEEDDDDGDRKRRRSGGRRGR